MQPGHGADSQDTLPWSSVLAGCGGCQAALLPSPCPCIGQLEGKQAHATAGVEVTGRVWEEEGSAVWECTLVLTARSRGLVSMARS